MAAILQRRRLAAKGKNFVLLCTIAPAAYWPGGRKSPSWLSDFSRLVAPFVHHARRAFDARFRDWAPEVTGRARSLPMACPPPPRPLAADPART